MTNEEREELKHQQRLLNASSREERDRIRRERDDARREQLRDFKPDPAKQADIEAQVKDRANKIRAAAAAMHTPAAEQDNSPVRRGRGARPTGKRAGQPKRQPRRRGRASKRKTNAAAPRAVNATEATAALINDLERLEKVAAWLPEAPPESQNAASEALTDLLQVESAAWTAFTTLEGRLVPHALVSNSDNDSPRHGPKSFLVYNVEDLFHTWLTLPEPRPPFPLMPLADACPALKLPPTRMIGPPIRW